MIDEKVNPLDVQVGGGHYKDMVIQPIEFFHANQTPYPEANACKYILRHKKKNGREDLEKAIHVCQMIIKMQYGEIVLDEKGVEENQCLACKYPNHAREKLKHTCRAIADKAYDKLVKERLDKVSYPDLEEPI